MIAKILLPFSFLAMFALAACDAPPPGDVPPADAPLTDPAPPPAM